MKSKKILMIFIIAISCRDDDFLLDSTPLLFTIPTML